MREKNSEIEVLDPLLKEKLINFFNRRFNFAELTCSCPDDDIKVIFETKLNIAHSFSFGVIGDGNAYYYNAEKRFGIPYEQYLELLELFSEFDEVNEYYSHSNFDWIEKS